jgi:magnesium chelatase subunit I
VFFDFCPAERLSAVVASFDGGLVAQVGASIPSAAYVSLTNQVPALFEVTSELVGEKSPAEIASAVELVLEGLYLSRRLNKISDTTGPIYRSR